MTTHLLPLLHAEFDNESAPPGHEVATSNINIVTPSSPRPHYHTLLTSHHLISPQKRRSLHQWSSDLRIRGFAKVGYPGIIYAEGARDDVEEFVGNVRAMQWLALRVRFVEPVAEGPTEGENDELKARWVEFEKVGEVVREMKRVGKEEFVMEMGIGSAGK